MCPLSHFVFLFPWPWGASSYSERSRVTLCRFQTLSGSHCLRSHAVLRTPNVLVSPPPQPSLSNSETIQGAGEVAHQLRLLLFFQGCEFSSWHSQLQLFVTLPPGDLMPFSGLFKHLHTADTLAYTHTHKNNKWD